MLRSTPEYITAYATNFAAQAPNREVGELLAQHRAERREKLVNLVQAIRKSIPRRLGVLIVVSRWSLRNRGRTPIPPWGCRPDRGELQTTYSPQGATLVWC